MGSRLREDRGGETGGRLEDPRLRSGHHPARPRVRRRRRIPRSGPASPPDTGNPVLHGLGVALFGAEESPARRGDRAAKPRGPPVSRRSDVGLRAGTPGRCARDSGEDPRRDGGPRLSRGEPENPGGGGAAVSYTHLTLPTIYSV